MEKEMAPIVDDDLVEIGYLGERDRLPLVIRPRTLLADLPAWVRDHEQWIEQQLLAHGALLFRGFPVLGVEEFEAFAETLCPDLYGEYEDLPREGGGKKVYQSTPYPADKPILFHNESAHMHRFPTRQFFHCVQPARAGGETPIVDCREIYRSLDPAVIEEFARKRLLYVRNFIDGFDVNWRTFFRTEEPQEVERYCLDNGIEVEWRGKNLQTRQLAPAVAHHVKTAEPVFFNQIQLHHAACLEPELRETLLTVLGKDNLPRSVCFGDGSPIAETLVEEITDLYWQCAAAFPWEAGDTLMVDNMLCAHARNPFSGPRKIVVAMGAIVQSADVS
jgi:alpha-ketoglutarate-dependent taurine dioxygenase